MPLKSWAFIHQGHPIRAEIWWRYTGWNRKRLYIDHRLAIGTRGRFTIGKPLLAEIHDVPNSDHTIQIRFRPRRLGLDMDCEISSDSTPPAPVQSARIEKGFRYSGAEDRADEESRDVQAFVFFVFIVPLLLFLAVLSGPAFLIAWIIQKRRERRLKRQMRLLGRSLSWPQVEERMRSLYSPSTLILQFGGIARRIWWTDDDLPARSPLPLPDPSAIFSYDNDHPFIEWCQHRYLDEPTGKAFLIELPESLSKRLDGFHRHNDPALLHDQYPSLNIIMTGQAHGKRLKASAHFARILGDSPGKSLPDLLSALEDQDPTIRGLCRETIQFAGAAAATAVPIFKRDLYFGPRSERFHVAQTLAALGPDGQSVLAEAAKVRDPSIARAAKSAIPIALQKLTAPPRPSPPAPQ